MGTKNPFLNQLDNNANTPANSNNSTQSKKQASSDENLFNLFSNFPLFKDKNNLTYIELEDKDANFNATGKRIVQIKSEDFKEYATYLYYINYFKHPSQNSLTSLLMNLVYRAKIAGKLIEVFNRIGIDDENNIYIDLADRKGRSVKISQNGWQVGNFPIIFTRYNHQATLPIPEQGGDLRDLLKFIPVEDEHDQCLLLCWLVASLIPDIERCFLALEGPHGAGKSAVALRLKSLIDPMNGDRLTLNGKEQEVAQQLAQHCLPYFDNVTSISQSISDIMCSCFSSSTYMKRELYTNDGSFSFNLTGNIIFTSIRPVNNRTDFLSRTYKVVIQKRERFLSQKKLMCEFEAVAPKLFGALLDTVVKVLNLVDSIPMPDKYRTVDFDHYCATAAEVLGFGQELFWEARGYTEDIKTNDFKSSFPLVKTLSEVLQRNGGYWKGCMKDLLPELKALAEYPEYLPSAENKLSFALKSLSVELKVAGITVKPRYNVQCRLYEIFSNCYNDMQKEIVEMIASEIEDENESNGTYEPESVNTESVIDNYEITCDINENLIEYDKIIAVTDPAVTGQFSVTTDDSNGEGALDLEHYNPFLVDDDYISSK